MVHDIYCIIHPPCTGDRFDPEDGIIPVFEIDSRSLDDCYDQAQRCSKFCVYVSHFDQELLLSMISFFFITGYVYRDGKPVLLVEKNKITPEQISIIRQACAGQGYADITIIYPAPG